MFIVATTHSHVWLSLICTLCYQNVFDLYCLTHCIIRASIYTAVIWKHTVSQNQRILGGEGISGVHPVQPTCQGKGHLEEVTQHVQVGFGWLQEKETPWCHWAACSSALHPLYSFPCCGGTFFSLVYGHCPLCCHWASLKRVWHHWKVNH